MGILRYISTRSGSSDESESFSFDDVLLAGLARDGGLYVPVEWPRFGKAEIRALQGLPYTDIALRVIQPFVGDSIPGPDLEAMIAESYAAFDHPAVAPLIQTDSNEWVCELFHGPTLAFKDYPLQLVGRLFDYVLKKQGRRVTIVGATSGDTGSAAMEAGRDKDGMEVFFLYPHGRVSNVQRRQMTTLSSKNVHAIALDGSFDDCQDMVKALFADHSFRDSQNLSAMNSINWARIVSQIVYYFTTAVALGAPDRKIAFSVPSGNFGNVYAGYAARKMGLPIEKFVVGSNANDILTRYFGSGEMSTAEVVPTLSPSMDIQISSNFERLLFDHYGRDGAALAKVMERFRRKGSINFGKARWRAMGKLFQGFRLGDNATKDVIASVYRDSNILLDPHSAIGVEAGRQADLGPHTALICMATAHPAKFPDAVEEATGVRPELPGHLSDLFEREERMTRLPNDIDAVRCFITENSARREAA